MDYSQLVELLFTYKQLKNPLRLLTLDENEQISCRRVKINILMWHRAVANITRIWWENLQYIIWNLILWCWKMQSQNPFLSLSFGSRIHLSLYFLSHPTSLLSYNIRSGKRSEEVKKLQERPCDSISYFEDLIRSIRSGFFVCIAYSFKGFRFECLFVGLLWIIVGFHFRVD